MMPVAGRRIDRSDASGNFNMRTTDRMSAASSRQWVGLANLQPLMAKLHFPILLRVSAQLRSVNWNRTDSGPLVGTQKQRNAGMILPTGYMTLHEAVEFLLPFKFAGQPDRVEVTRERSKGSDVSDGKAMNGIMLIRFRPTTGER
jgi:hypothetical protein